MALLGNQDRKPWLHLECRKPTLCANYNLTIVCHEQEAETSHLFPKVKGKTIKACKPHNSRSQFSITSELNLSFQNYIFNTTA